MRLNWLLKLYPRTWRRRYETEVTEVLEQHDAGLGTALDLLSGAFDARLHAEVRDPAPTSAAPPATPTVRGDAAALLLAESKRNSARDAAQSAAGATQPEERSLRIARYVESAIQQAAASGAFDNLPGKGKPIRAELLQPADDRGFASSILAGGGFLPRWLELQHEIQADLAECRRIVERTERFPPLVNREGPLADMQTRLAAVREKARRYNLTVPSMDLQRRLPDTTDLLRRMARALGTAKEER